MFSRRTRWDRTPNRLSLLLEAKRRAGSELLDLTESNPTRAGLLAPAEVLGLLADPGALAYDPQPAGLRGARDAVAAQFERHGARVDPGRIVLTASSSEAYSHLFKLLCDPGDSVLVPRPSYPLFEYLARLESLEVARYPLAYDGAWHLPLDALRAAITPRTRAIVVVHPNNPTGSFLERDEAGALLALCAERGIAVLSDEVFADYADQASTRRFGSFAGDGPALAFALGGLSKSCGLPQLKLGWIAAAGPASLRDEALARLEIVADTYLSVATPVQRAAGGILARLPELQRPIAERVRANRELLAAATLGSPVTLLAAEGGWYAILQVPATLSEEDRVCRLLDASGVLVHPGFFFDFEREAFLVLSLLPEPARFAQGVARILADAVL
jgi:hypothetical protein